MTGPRKIAPPFRADHVGSLLRPDRLLQARKNAGLGGVGEAASKGNISAEDLRAIEDDCIREIVAIQEDVGLEGITDGECRRASWAIDFLSAIEGITMVIPESNEGMDFTGNVYRPPVPTTIAKLTRPKNGILLEDFKFLKSITSKTPKITLPAPEILHYRGGRAAVDQEVYPEMEDFFADIIKVYSEEVQGLASAGCIYLQIDNTDTALLCDPEQAKREQEKVGLSMREQVSLQARLINGAIKNHPPEMAISMHMCRGNNQGQWVAEGGYEPVAEQLFSEFDVDAYFMEYDSERAGDFEPLRFVPDDRLVVLGLITTKTPENDPKDQLKRRIDEAAKYIPIENLAISPQCGMASAFLGNPITFDDQRRKFALALEVAEEVWGEI